MSSDAGHGAPLDQAELDRRLAELDAHPPAEHVAVYAALHEELQDALGAIDGA